MQKSCVCRSCGKQFDSPKSNTLYCTRVCVDAAKLHRMGFRDWAKTKDIRVITLTKNAHSIKPRDKGDLIIGYRCMIELFDRTECFTISAKHDPIRDVINHMEGIDAWGKGGDL